MIFEDVSVALLIVVVLYQSHFGSATDNFYQQKPVGRVSAAYPTYGTFIAEALSSQRVNTNLLSLDAPRLGGDISACLLHRIINLSALPE